MMPHGTLQRVLLALVVAGPLAAQAPKRPMSFLDMQLMKQVGGTALSPDGKWLLYTVSVPDWKEARRYTDIWIVSTGQGVPSARQLTFTKDKNEGNPRWARDGSFFVFSSNRDATGTQTGDQLYLMRADGGEARKITDVKDGVGAFALSRDGKWLGYAGGKSDEQQLWTVSVDGLASGEAVTPVQATRHATPVSWWAFSRDGQRIYFLAPDTVDKDNKTRIEKKFDVRIRNQDTPLQQLWIVDLAGRQERRLTSGADYSVERVVESPDGKWIGFAGAPNNRYERNITEANDYTDLYLLEVSSGKIERLTNNKEIGESAVSFSPDGSSLVFAAENDFVYARDPKLYLRPVAPAGGPLKKLGETYDGGLSVGWWSGDGKTIYFNDGVRATNQVLALDLATNTVRPVIAEKASVSATRNEDGGAILISYADPANPGSLYLARSEAEMGDRSTWIRLTNPNPQVAGLALGAAEEITWKSKDGRMVGGVLLKPVGYTAGRKYPLIVAIHGGPAGADVLGFNGGYGSQVFAGAGYAVLMPNYRGSTNYGEKHRMEVAGDYFTKGYDDIMTGVDYLIAQGIVHPDSMGVMGWSAGGHYADWILTHTTRFKAISSGAGTANWISMYAQSDVQRSRQWYLGGKLPYDDLEGYLRQSPIKYIRNAKTPTLIHVVDGDPRVPRPQSEELHMALKRLGVPTEFLVYPGASHGIPDPHNQLLRNSADLAWFEHWIRGRKDWLQWKDLLKTLEDAP
jgi:dipeptidyl aminopeptidase/acylaminoacyl peptidase